jgi:glycine cleavage system T protein (aminomethyltransferase)
VVIGALVRDYGDPAGEAAACRSDAALFDFSFMHRARVEGPNAVRLVQSLTPRPIADLAPGRIRYALHVDNAGHVRADLTIWRIGATTFEVFSGREDEIALLRATDSTAVTDLTGETAILAVQGPRSLACLSGLTPLDELRDLAYFAHAAMTVAGLHCRVGRLGYTGERGFEIVLPREGKGALWTALAARAQPAGFTAADRLRIEAGFILFANELRFPVTPAELGLARFAAGPTSVPRVHLIGFRACSESDPILFTPSRDAAFPPTPGMILATSACRSAVASGIIGLGYVAAGDSSRDLVDPMGVFGAVTITDLPFVDPGKHRPRGDWDDDALRS